MSAELLLQARGLHTYYGASHILHGVDFTVARGETVGLMGRNGMGKSTLLKSMLGLVPPREGEVSVKGRVVTDVAPHAIARMGIAYVPEGRGIFPNLSVRENLLMAARPGADGQNDWTFERVMETFPRLSERLDEATEGLAPLIAREIWSIVKRIKAAGIATVIVDKNFKAVSAISDRVVILVKGVVVFEGASADLHARPELHRQHLGV
jgi:branched-chain amino acid transport system ATP-binding protein